MTAEADKQNISRYERKFLVTALTRKEIETIIKLHPAMFREKYYERFVNNIYFDSLNMKNYLDSVDGQRNRMKVRIRWYGDLFGTVNHPALEIKSKDGYVNKKRAVRLPPFHIDRDLRLQEVRAAVENSQAHPMLKLQLMSLEATLLNRYRRKYFESNNQKCRITIDSEMKFYQIRGCGAVHLVGSVDRVHTVVELKYDLESDEVVRWIASYFPFRLSRSSKYVSGLARLFP